MFTEIYIEALLVDEEMADQVWEPWDAGLMNDLSAIRTWLAFIQQAATLNASACAYL